MARSRIIYLAYRKARKVPWDCPTQKGLGAAGSYTDVEVSPYKTDILYHSTLLKRSKPHFDVTYHCSYGSDTSEFKPTIYLFGNNRDVLGFSKSFSSVLNIANMSQYRNDSHESIITAIVNHPTSSIVASGDETSMIHVWEYHSNLLINFFKAPFSGGPVKLSFSENERHLAGLFIENDDYYLAVFDIHQGEVITSVCLGMKEVRSIMYKKKLEIVSIGDGHLFSWKLNNGNLIGDAIHFHDFGRNLICQAMNKLDMIIGTATGKLQVFREQLHSEKSLFQLQWEDLVFGCIQPLVVHT